MAIAGVSMIMLMLGVLDIIAGFLLVFGTAEFLAGSAIAGLFAFLLFFKALFSIISAAAENFYFDVPGWLDILAAIGLAMLYFGMQFEFFFYVGAAMLMKGVYSFLVGSQFLLWGSS